MQHEIWSHWMRYLFSVSHENEDGSVTIDRENVIRWKRQMQTKYSDLTDNEKKSDRDQALKVISALK
ncbi:hypothetical protein ACTQ9L_03785 [Deinococcus wulumuqiensis]